LFNANISGDGRKRANFRVRMGMGEHDGAGIVHAGVGINEEWNHFDRAIAAGIMQG
jgi:hypothetical protein